MGRLCVQRCALTEATPLLAVFDVTIGPSGGGVQVDSVSDGSLQAEQPGLRVPGRMRG